MRYYTYVYTIDGVPEYVGFGSNRERCRCLEHVKPTAKKSRWVSHLHKAVANLRDIRIHIVAVFDNPQAAFTEEKRLIALYGRRDRGTGTLYNLTDGGEGAVGAIHSDEVKAKRNATLKGHPGAVYTHTQEAKDQIRASRVGAKWSNETRERMMVSQQRRRERERNL